MRGSSVPCHCASEPPQASDHASPAWLQSYLPSQIAVFSTVVGTAPDSTAEAGGDGGLRYPGRVRPFGPATRAAGWAVRRADARSAPLLVFSLALIAWWLQALV